MKLARKLLAALALLLVTLLGLSGYFGVQREVQVFEGDMRRDHGILGTVLARTLVEPYRAGGRAQAEATLAQLVGGGPPRVQWLDPGEVASPSVRAGNDHPTFVPVQVDGRTVGVLQIAESFASVRAYVRRTIVRNLVLASALAIGAALVVFLLTVRMIGRPMQLLREKTRQIGAGQLDPPLQLGRNDELAELAADVNQMCEQLKSAARRIQAETEGRLNALDQLRHADRLATVGTLASGIAHEVGTPLGVMLVQARMIEDRDLVGDDAARAGKIIATQIERVSRVIRQLLDFARSRGQNAASPRAEPLALEDADLVALARTALDLVAPLADRAGVALAVESGGAVLAPVDAGLIQQVIVNLVMNALQASPRGTSVAVRIERARAQPPRQSDLDAPTPASEHALIAVHDHGPGIPAAVLPRIFEPFFTTKDIGQGTGLGLAVSYGIVREHGGWIAVQSEAGQGALFSVFLPLRPADARSTGAAREQMR